MKKNILTLLGKTFFLEELEAEAEPEQISHKQLFKTLACFILNWNKIFYCDIKRMNYQNTSISLPDKNVHNRCNESRAELSPSIK